MNSCKDFSNHFLSFPHHFNFYIPWLAGWLAALALVSKEFPYEYFTSVFINENQKHMTNTNSQLYYRYIVSTLVILTLFQGVQRLRGALG